MARFDDYVFSEMDRALPRALHPFAQTIPSFQAGSMQHVSAQPMDVIEYSDKYCIVVDVPGITGEEIKVEQHGDRLMICAEATRKVAAEEGSTSNTQIAAGKYHIQERALVKFSRSFALPEDAVVGSITARIDAGVLTVEIPKKPRQASAPAVRRIMVRTAATAEPAGPQ